MDKLLFFVLINFFCFNTFANIHWEETRIPYNYNINKDLTKKKCLHPNEVSKQVRDKNSSVDFSRLWAENFLMLPYCPMEEKIPYADPYKPANPHPKAKTDITKWDTITVEKGFILSEYLWSEECTLIWSKHIPLFREKNPHIKNTNIISKGEVIKVQSCKEKQIQIKSVKKEKKYITYPFYIYYGFFRRDDSQNEHHFGAFADFQIEKFNYELNVQNLNRLFFANHFSIDLIKKNKQEFATGMTLFNTIGLKNAPSVFARYEYQYNSSNVTRVQLGSNLKNFISYLKLQHSYRRLRAFYMYFDDQNIINQDKSSKYHVMGIGFLF